MKRSLLSTCTVLCVLSACAGAATQNRTELREPASDPATWSGDARLYQILLPYPMTDVQRDSLRAYIAEHPISATELIAEAALDTAAPSSVRVNALFLLAERRADTHMHVFRAALDAEDVRVRASAVAAMRELVETHPREAHRIARAALSDSATEVQAQALQVLGDTDIDLLREYVERATHPELRLVAEGLVQLAEQRGAPLRTDTTTGRLWRVTPSGWRIEFIPDRSWPEWNAAVGMVELSRPDAESHLLHSVEAVAGVVPVFLSPDGRQAVYERNRLIVVRSLEDGAERIVGRGIAPRVRPFTTSFVYLREIPGSAVEEREKTKLSYEVYTMPFDAPARVRPTVIDTVTATVSFGVNGSYSPVRWMKVEERGGTFYLTAPGMDIVTLPDPFDQG